MNDTTQLTILMAAMATIAITLLSAALPVAEAGFKTATQSIEQSMVPACPTPAGKTNGDTP